MNQVAQPGAWSGGGLWRYRRDLSIDGDPVTLGEGATPLLRHGQVWLKLEGISPTGSFKDRGASTAITAARAAGARTVVEDSSGNAGTSVAAYAAVRYSGGRWLSVSEDAIGRAWHEAAHAGLLIEPTSAAALAGARALNLPPSAAVIITGSGLKAVDRY